MVFKTMSLCAAVMAAATGFGAVVVHDAGRDLALNSASASVFTNAAGGVWSFMRSAAPTGDRTLMPAVRERASTTLTDSNGLRILHQRGPAAASNGSPAFAVNPTAWADNQTFMRGDGYPFIPPGQLSCHPGDIADEGNQCCVLRFTFPRTGMYSVMAKAWNQNTGWTAVSLLVNGEVRKDRVAWKSPAAAVVTNDFSLAAAKFNSGDFVELTVDGNNTYYSNATGIRFEIEEIVEQLIDAGAAMQAHVIADGASATAAFSTEDGVWRAEVAANGTNVTANLSRTLLESWCVREAQGSNLSGWDMTGLLPRIYVNATGAYASETNEAGQQTFCTGRAIAPGELFIHPNLNQPAVLSFTPARSGRYDIGIVARDLNLMNNSHGDGVLVKLVQGARLLAEKHVATESGLGLSSSGTIFMPGVVVAAGVPLELVVDQFVYHESDSTALTWQMVKVGEDGIYSANAAMIANLNGAAPAASYSGEGASWQVGTRGSDGEIKPFATLQNLKFNDTMKAFGNTASTSPYFGANLSGASIPANWVGNNIAAGNGMLLAHPSSSEPAMLRFSVPKKGVYDVKSFFMDCANTGGDGVNVQVFINGVNIAEAAVYSAANQIDHSSIDVPELKLRANDFVDFVIDLGVNHNSDLTGAYIWLSRKHDPVFSRGTVVTIK